MLLGPLNQSALKKFRVAKLLYTRIIMHYKILMNQRVLTSWQTQTKASWIDSITGPNDINKLYAIQK